MMAAPMSFCRIKLSINKQGLYRHEKQWHTIDFSHCKTVNCAVNNILKVFKIKCCICELYMQDIVIPRWETCAHVFRDNDEVELRCVTDGGDQELSSNALVEYKKEQSHNDVSEYLQRNSITHDSDYEPKPKKKKRKSKTAQESENSKANTQVESLSLCADANSTRFSKPDQELSGCMTSPQHRFKDELDTKGVATAESLEVTNTVEVDDETDESDEREKRKKARQEARSAELTPIEQALIAELESLPKAKRHRKRKRKRAKQATESSATKAPETERSAVIGPVCLNSSYQGKKKVFDSDEEKEALHSAATDIEGRAEFAHKSWEQIYVCKGEDAKSVDKENQLSHADKVQLSHADKEESYIEEESKSCVKVTPRTISPAPVAPTPFSLSQTAISSADIPTIADPSTSELNSSAVPESHRMQNSSAKKQQFTNFVNKKNSRHKPVVYKREKLKLRATFSPAVLEQLQKVTANGCDREPDNSSCPKPLPVAQPSKGFKRHQGKVSNSTPKASSAKDEQLKDEQLKDEQLLDELTNVSAIRLCNSSQDASQTLTASSSESVEIKDYSGYPALDGPPRAGDRLAFKRLEVSADYTPVVSEYKEATVLSYEPKSKLVHVRVTNAVKRAKRNGVFDIHIEEDDETFTNVEGNQDEIVDTLTTFLEVKLLPS
ncbi:coilin-like isoform X2 [Watersipora subatra]|uniref:coilin-like isoform X2 n=1 Tax=Watersipora subatra TaxID=2589382 RepID=UPI00355B2ECB